MRSSYINTRTCIGAAAFGAAAGLLAMSSWAPAQEAASKDELFSATAAISLPGKETLFAFDISSVEPTLSTYVLADRTNKAVDVVNTETLGITQLVATPPFAGATGNNNTSGPDGVIIVVKKNNGDGLDEVWAGDGPTATCPLTAASTVPDLAGDPTGLCSTVKVIDLKTGMTKHVIATGGRFRADESCVDTKDGLFMTANNADSPPFGTIISTMDYTVKHQVSFTNSTNGAEQCQWSPRTGLFYITIPGVNAAGNQGVVDVIDPKTGKIVNTFPIPLQVCSTPQGMALGPDKQIMVGCNGNDSTNGLHSGIIINENTGSVTHVIPNESGPDEVYYNGGDGQYFLGRSAPVGSNQLLGVVDANGAKADSSVITGNKVVTGASIHSVAADSGTNKVFVPIPGCNPKTGCLGTPPNVITPSTVCSSEGGIDANGCIAVFTASPDDKGKPIVGRSNGNNDD
jgi:hypothetical protein